MRRAKPKLNERLLEHDASTGDGWHEFEEQPGGAGQRWTTGSAPLPSNTRLIVADIIGRGGYWSQRGNDVTALFG